MTISRLKRKVFLVLAIAGILTLIAAKALKKHGPDLTAADIASLNERRFEIAGDVYSTVNGNAYKLDRSRNGWEFVDHLYDPNFFKDNYAIENGVTFRRDHGTGKLHQVGKTFRDDFEGVQSIHDLIGETRRWTEFTLQSPKAASIQEYVALRGNILKKTEGFRDNSIEPAMTNARSGKTALRFHSVAKSHSMVCAKTSLSTEVIHFTKGDDFWFSGCYYISKGSPTTLMDLESSWISESPGPRIMLDKDCVMVELKWADKPTYRQPDDTRIPFPRNQWVRVKVHYKLSERSDGVIEVWQDGRQIISATGRNLPLADTILNSLEIGISATQDEATIFVDDIEVSGEPLQ